MKNITQMKKSTISLINNIIILLAFDFDDRERSSKSKAIELGYFVYIIQNL